MKRFISKFPVFAFLSAVALVVLVVAAATVSAEPNDPAGTSNDDEAHVNGGGPTTFYVFNDLDLASAMMSARRGDTIQVAKGASYSTFMDSPKVSSGVKIKGAALIAGKIETGRGVRINNLGMYYVRSPRDIAPFALWTHGSATIKGVVIYLPSTDWSVGIMAANPVPMHRKFQYVYVVEDTKILGAWVNSDSEGLLLNLPIDRETSIIRGNTFVGLECGIKFSIDNVFSDMPPEKRMEAYLEYAGILESQNFFLGVVHPVCAEPRG